MNDYDSDSLGESFCNTCANGALNHRDIVLTKLARSEIEHVHLPGDATFYHQTVEGVSDMHILEMFPCITDCSVMLEKMDTSEQGIINLIALSANQNKVGYYKQYLYGKGKKFPEADWQHRITGIGVNEIGLLSKEFVLDHDDLDTVQLQTDWSQGGVDYGQKRIAKSEIVLVQKNMKVNVRKFFHNLFMSNFKQIYLKQALDLHRGIHKTQKQLDSVIHSAFCHAMRYLMEVNRPEEFENIDEMHEALERCLFMVRNYARIDKDSRNTPEQQLFASICIPSYNAAILLVLNLEIPTELTPLDILLNFKNNRVNAHRVYRVDQRNIKTICPMSEPNLLSADEWGPFHYSEDEKHSLRRHCTGRLYSKNRKRRRQHPLSKTQNDEEISDSSEYNMTSSESDSSDHNENTNKSIEGSETTENQLDIELDVIDISQSPQADNVENVQIEDDEISIVDISDSSIRCETTTGVSGSLVRSQRIDNPRRLPMYILYPDLPLANIEFKIIASEGQFRATLGTNLPFRFISQQALRIIKALRKDFETEVELAGDCILHISRRCVRTIDAKSGKFTNYGKPISFQPFAIECDHIRLELLLFMSKSSKRY